MCGGGGGGGGSLVVQQVHTEISWLRTAGKLVLPGYLWVQQDHEAYKASQDSNHHTTFCCCYLNIPISIDKT